MLFKLKALENNNFLKAKDLLLQHNLLSDIKDDDNLSDTVTELKFSLPSNQLKKLGDKLKKINYDIEIINQKDISEGNKDIEGVNLTLISELKQKEKAKQQQLLQAEEAKKKEEAEKLYESTKHEIKCITCGGIKFTDNKELRDHMKNEWHKNNVKRKLNGKGFITEDEYILECINNK